MVRDDQTFVSAVEEQQRASRRAIAESMTLALINRVKQGETYFYRVIPSRSHHERLSGEPL